MTRLVLGVLGHVDHGKTALVRALTGTDTDRLPEEKRRGISIALGFAHLAEAGIIADLIDMPGHERFVRTMIAGATGIDAVLLVVAANERIKPQTREHADIARLLGIRRALVAVSKTDMVDPATAAAVAAETSSWLERVGLRPAATVLTSAQTGAGVDALRTAIARLGANQARRPEDGVAFLPIDRAFSIEGHGTVITGTLRGAKLRPGDTLELLPGGRPVRIRALQVHGVRVTSAAPGQRVAANLRDIEVTAVPSGAALAAAGALPPSDWLTVALQAVGDAPPLPTGLRVQALLGTAEIPARLRLLDRDTLEPGETGLAQLRLAAPAAIPAREHVVLRLASPARTVAGGRILEAETRRHPRGAAPVLERLRRLARDPPAQTLARELDQAGAAGARLQHLSRLTGLAPARVAAHLHTLPVLLGRHGVAVGQATLATVTSRVLDRLAARALTRDALAALLPDVGAEVLDEALARLLAAGRVRQAGGAWDVPRPDQDAARSRDEARIARELAEQFRRSGLTPSDPAPSARRTVERLLREGVVVRAHDSGQKRDVLFHRDAIEQARRTLRPLLDHAPGMLVSEIGAALGISRKYSVPLLEHLDSAGFTRRLGDRRVLASSIEAP